MSADNWAICPRCLDTARRGAEREREAVMALYGTVPIEEFEEERAALKDVDLDDFRTFREDYDFYGAEEGTVVAEYSGVCSKCNLTAELHETRPFYPPAEAPDA